MSAAPKFAPAPARRAMLAKLHLARKELALSEGDYRAVLARVTGLSSAAAMTDAQLHACLDEFRRLGWQQRSPSRGGPQSSGSDLKVGRAARPADHPAARKTRALWISLHQLGAVRNGSEAALEAFARRQLGVERLQWADQAQVYKLTEALKAMAERAGWRQTGLVAGFEAPELARRLIVRLHELLVELVPDALPIRDRVRCIGRWERAPMAELYGLADQLARELAEARAKAGGSGQD